MFIGYFSLANTVTLFGLISAVTSCFLAAKGDIKFAVYMMFLSFVCDMFDGRIARRTKNRTEAAKFYGIQLDSLCDLVSFGVTPCFIAYNFGFDGGIDVFIYGLFIVCGATRLAYFNTLANQFPQKSKNTFRGIPIPASTMLVTILFLLTTFINPNVMVWFFRVCYFLLAIGYVLNIRLNKPGIKAGLTLISVQIVLLLALLLADDCRMPEKVKDDNKVVTEESNKNNSNTSADLPFQINYNI